MYAAVEGDREKVKILLDASADLNARDKDVGTALAWAAVYNRVAMTESLLARGADPNINNEAAARP